MATKPSKTDSKKGPRSIAKDLRSAASALEHGRHATARKKLATIAPSFSPRQTDTILAALRVYQDVGRADILIDADEIASEHGEPLSSSEIDVLCEQINLGPKLSEGDMECDCADRSWYGREHDSACPFAGQSRVSLAKASQVISRSEWETSILDEALNSAE